MTTIESDLVTKELETFLSGLRRRNPGETEFHQAVAEVAESIMPFYLDHQNYRDAYILGADDRARQDCHFSRHLGS